MKCPVAEVLGREMLEYELIPYLETEGACPAFAYLKHPDFNFECFAQVFLSFFFAAGKRMLFKIRRYPGEFL